MSKLGFEIWKKKAFTLAEVLITLSIIGVVAALTIPTLIQRTGDEEIVSKLMKVYSTLSQATETIITEQGSPKVWNTNVDTLYNAYKAKLRISKDCGSGTGCMKGNYKYLRGADIGGTFGDKNTSRRRLILSDGAVLEFVFVSNACNSELNGSKGVCAFLDADLNGSKAPNQLGRDTFSFTLKESGLYPIGCDDETAASCNTVNGHGSGCACKVISEGAINY